MPESDLALLERAAIAAGEVAMRFFGNDPEVWEKDGEGPVSEADIAVNALLEDILRDGRPDYGWLSEETQDDGARLDTQRQFIVDPIDGTRAFLKGDRDWSHALAIVEEGEPVAAVVHLPARDETFTGFRGAGAARNGSPIRVSAPASLGDARVLSTKANLRSHHWQDGVAPSFARSYRSSLAYRMCLAGSGRFDAMMALHQTWEWDVVAGSLIVAEAGGRVRDRHGNAPRFNNATPQLDGIIAGAEGIVAALVQRLVPSPAIQ